MLQRLTINLSKLEQQALETIAANELRDKRDQARFILRQELERRGLLAIGTQANTELARAVVHPLAQDAAKAGINETKKISLPDA